jgi:hypothetical protein
MLGYARSGNTAQPRKEGAALTQPTHRAAESSGCDRFLFSSCYLLLFEANKQREMGTTSSPFPVLLPGVTRKITAPGCAPVSCIFCYLREDGEERAGRKSIHLRICF